MKGLTKVSLVILTKVGVAPCAMSEVVPSVQKLTSKEKLSSIIAAMTFKRGPDSPIPSNEAGLDSDISLATSGRGL